ncbi:hypothetical protein M441DRAFT_380517 [Trichoderma asperellum CBS 433.97]|uniref:Uncharacterized protein n=1 Tax=Trichoderma asperellum (strain ATCC 204424 / CBS 433.97 / NBRC 101777) TaxID=1042311 RepID=A0A2T3ZB14_TRIA4|nr:hypothetical protein M441DRAFT_380517 [Trichoderma asperellum CBS 433.97]PTB41986.1 hypothetical protein M441DRAFT_380517 [Trichoderma asperellum CBS 433.97]
MPCYLLGGIVIVVYRFLFISLFFPNRERLGVTRLQPQANATNSRHTGISNTKAKRKGKKAKPWPIKGSTNSNNYCRLIKQLHIKDCCRYY